MANKTWKFVQAKSKQAMKQVLGIRDEKARMKVTPLLAVAPITQEDGMRWNPNDDGIVFNRVLRPITTASIKHAPATSRKNQQVLERSVQPSAFPHLYLCANSRMHISGARTR